MGKMTQNRQEKYERILAVAQSMFLLQGYQQTRMDLIAEQAHLTKQTLYRYFPSKIALFKAALQTMGKQNNTHFTECLKQPDSRAALTTFAKKFIAFHTSEHHIATYRLLITENRHSPEIVQAFFSIGSNSTREKLEIFFAERFSLNPSKPLVDLWLGMLLSIRSDIALGKRVANEESSSDFADNCVDFLLKAYLPLNNA